MIFIQIAAYRDPELLPTITDCLDKAKYPNDLRFGICWQKESSETCLDSFADDSRFRIESIPWKDSEGLCWARSRIQNLYEGETYTLQLDSHHRFAENWDEWLINSLSSISSEKPLLTSYASPYSPDNEDERKEVPFKMVAQRFTKSGTILFLPHSIPDYEKLNAPIKARFVSGHYFFTIGKHCEEYKYDPNLYFAGDEISLSVRSYTLGYDLFHPHRNVVWHEYTRNNRTKHWDDHTLENVSRAWHERDKISKERLRNLLGMESGVDLGAFGVGDQRSLQDFERYAGVDFKGRRLQRDTLAGVDPPCQFSNEEEWEGSFGVERTLTLNWDSAELKDSSNFQFVFFGVEDADGTLLYRFDAQPDAPEFKGLVAEKEVSFFSSAPPSRFVLWPFLRSGGWGEKIVHEI